MVWWIQWRSWQPGGLRRLSEEIRDLLPPQTAIGPMGRSFLDDPRMADFLEEDGIKTPRPAQTPSAEAIEEALAQFCLDPHAPDIGPLRQGAGEIREAESAFARSGLAVTEAVRQIWPALNRCASQRSVVLVEGPARVGKTAAARAWCDASKGIGRLIQTPHGNDLDPLFRAIAKAIGTAYGEKYKANQVESRILKALPGSGLSLVFDDAWNLWPQGDIRQSHPRRLQWLLGLLDSGIGVGLVTAPQWWDCRRAFIAQTGWAVDQLDGRLACIVSLPSKLSLEDALAVVKSVFPAASPAVLNGLGKLAASSLRRLGAIDGVFKEAVYIARQAGRPSPAEEDFKAAALIAAQTEDRLAEETTVKGRHVRPLGTGMVPGGDGGMAIGVASDRRAAPLGSAAETQPRSRGVAAEGLPAMSGGRLGLMAHEVFPDDGNGSGDIALPVAEGCLE